MRCMHSIYQTPGRGRLVAADELSWSLKERPVTTANVQLTCDMKAQANRQLSQVHERSGPDDIKRTCIDRLCSAGWLPIIAIDG